jgi:hypothetical protein
MKTSELTGTALDWAGIIRTSREWLRSGSEGSDELFSIYKVRGRGIRLHMKAHKAYLDTLRMEAR